MTAVERRQALAQLRLLVNRFPDYIAYVVERLKQLSPSMGKVKSAETLSRAGLHFGATSIGRMLKGPRKTCDSTSAKSSEKPAAGRVVTAKRPNHVWHIDLTIVPTDAGLWCSWLPGALPQCWPFCYWVRGQLGAELTLEVSFHRGRKHLPIVKLKRAA